ncbi:enoyl-CoA hydratase/isomerase family protein [Mangrovitalea sediminis]|uniref:enoyl-CoA hydratase/isomerase family protein n=1 Tax=Mangrovitalea sediminis TaxID=1982043 RepID=UPI000BE5C7C7|nr:enoyl-CoA hydratase/isomerase family protein [Mangrovitalea sediminis]
MTDTAPVLFEERACADGHRIGLITLNVPKALNALGLEMIDAIYPRLLQWQDDDGIACVFLQGSGDRAFCAGGDIVHLYRSMVEADGGPNQHAEDFFTREYRLDYLMHTYAKPIICWGNGVVMGGGLGLMSACSHRVVTESARIAMPEVSIGLYPDVGGTWFLNRMPDGSGLFLGLTGAHCNASDALELGWADHFLPHSEKDSLLQALCDHVWDQAESRHSELSALLLERSAPHRAEQPEGQVAHHRELIQRVTSSDNLIDVVNAILSAPEPDTWLARAQKSLAHGCPTTAHLVWRQLHGGRDLSLADVFRRELIMSVRCTRFGEMREGVRALLIEKDNQPKWAYARVEDVPADYVDGFFVSPWAEDAHPLRDLGN